MIARKNLVSLTVLFVVVFSTFNTKTAEAQNSDYRFHTVFIYNFTKYLQWPSGAGDKGDFVIGVIGNSPIISSLNQMAASKNVNGKKIVVKKFNDASSMAPCHIIYVPNKEAGQIGGVVGNSKQYNALVISESPGLCKKGSHINFILQQGKWRFELNKANTESNGIKVSNQLNSLAIPCN